MILRALKPSQQICLAGLDDITAAEMDGFAKIIEYPNSSRQHIVVDELEKGKRYLKTVYQTHCSHQSTIASHSPAFALSTSKEEPCVVVGEDVCADCYDLVTALNACINIVEANGSEDQVYDVNR